MVAGLVLAAGLAWAGCDSSSKVEETFLLEGEIGRAETSSTHVIEVVDGGIGGVWVDELTPMTEDPPADGEDGDPFAAVVGLIVGRGLLEDGTCAAEGRFTVAEGEVFFFTFNPGTRCVEVFDVGVIPVGGSMEYLIRVEISR